MIEDGLYNHLAAELGHARIYPHVLPQRPPHPSVTYRRFGTRRDRTFEGDNGFVQIDMAVDAWAVDWRSCRLLADQILAALNDHAGALGGEPCHRIHYDDTTVEVYESSVEAYRITQVFSIWAQEP